jgi:uncharacterized surface protein with fasciclin (FAS1) repeats
VAIRADDRERLEKLRRDSPIAPRAGMVVCASWRSLTRQPGCGLRPASHTDGETQIMIRSFSVLLVPALLAMGCSNSTSTNPEPVESSAVASAEVNAKNIVEVAVEAGKFNTLATALEAADLVETLQGPGPFTVFAPTDEAFAALPEGALEGLLAEPEELKAVLLLHVVQGKVMASDVVNLEAATAVSGGTLAIDTSDGVKVGAATVVTTDIEASNGVIHVIDTVLLPG